MAIGMLTIFSYTALTSILEPIIYRKPFQKAHLFLALLLLLGIGFLTPVTRFEQSIYQAIAFGLFSATAYSPRTIIMKKQVAYCHGSLLMGCQMLIVSVLLLPFCFLVPFEKVMDNLPLLLILALLTTAIGHTLFLMTFKHLNMTTARIISSVQPIYGIVIGVVVLDEIPATKTSIGGILILCAVFIESLRASGRRNKIKL